MLSYNSKTTRYSLIFSCLVGLLYAQVPGLLSSTVGAGSSAALPSAPLLQGSLCVSGSLDGSGPNTDPTFNRPGSSLPIPPCVLTGAFTLYDAYSFTVTGCANPTVTISTCTGPCGTQSSLDTLLFVYQKGGGAPAGPAGTSPIFGPANPCTNLKTANNNFCSPASQITTTIQTTASTGDFVVVVTANSPFAAGNPTTFGSYNLRVDAPGCTVIQEPAPCFYSLNPTGDTFVAAGASDSVAVTTGPACAWTAASNDAFITVDSGTPGLGSGTVGYTVAANTGPARIGSMTIAGQTFTVTQEAGAVTLPCIMDALVAGPTFHRPSAGPITCPTSPGAVTPQNPQGFTNPAVFYKAYEMTLSGCPSGTVTASTCGTSPCSGAGTLADTVLFIYRKTDGSPSTMGSPIFDPTAPCTNVIAANNNFCGSLSQVSAAFNAGSFVVVVASNGAAQTGTFNLGITAPGCTLSQCPAITGTVSGGGTICAGDSSTITVTLSGGTPPYTVTLDNSGGTQTGPSPLNFTVSPAATTTYSVASGTDSVGCPVTGSGSATVTVNQPPTTATTGGPQSICSGGTTAGLGGNTPTVGTGSWSVVSGGTGTFNPNASTPNATFTHTSGSGPIVVRWTISNPPCPDSTADVTITIDQPPTTSNAGPDQSVCGSSTTLAANAPAVGTGTWSVVSGSGTFTDSHDPNTTVTGLSVGANVLRWTITNGACPPSFDDVTITSGSATTVSALGNANVWVGLKNSDDVGTKFDFLAEVLKNGVVIGSGEINDQPGGSSGFNNAILRTIAMALSPPTSHNFCSGDTLSFRLSVRIAASSGHVSGTARLWYNDAAANSRFNAIVNGASTDYFLLNGFVLGTAAGPGPKKTSDVLVNRNVGGNPFKPFGTWTKTF